MSESRDTSASDSTSWVETTCPPGWGVCQGVGDARWHTCRPRVVRDGDGCPVWVDNEAAANRLAWERWALEVLGGRVRWEDFGHGSVSVRSGSVYCLCSPCDGGEYGTDGRYRQAMDYAVSVTGRAETSVSCLDPVEALARLAALTLAVAGPEVTP